MQGLYKLRLLFSYNRVSLSFLSFPFLQVAVWSDLWELLLNWKDLRVLKEAVTMRTEAGEWGKMKVEGEKKRERERENWELRDEKREPANAFIRAENK